MKVTQFCPTLCDPMDCPWNSPGQNTGVGSLSLLQGIFPGIEPRSPAFQADSFPAEPPGKPSEAIYYIYINTCVSQTICFLFNSLSVSLTSHALLQHSVSFAFLNCMPVISNFHLHPMSFLEMLAASSRKKKSCVCGWEAVVV